MLILCPALRHNFTIENISRDMSYLCTCVLAILAAKLPKLNKYKLLLIVAGRDALVTDVLPERFKK